MNDDPSALGSFLRSRRDRITPSQAGIRPFPGPRRVPGLRKEELAVLVGISADHYSRLEQGRQSTLAPDLVDGLARALRLDAVEHDHLKNLATPPRRAGTTWERAQQADPGLLRLLITLEHVPALLLGRRSDVLARNALLVEVLGTELPVGSSFVRWLITDPDARERIANWPEFASASIGALRFELGTHPTDRRLRALVDELTDHEPAVAQWWADQRVTDKTSLTKEIAHPAAGPLSFGIESVVTPHDPSQRLVIYTVPPDSLTAAVMPMLRSWSARLPEGEDHLTNGRRGRV